MLLLSFSVAYLWPLQGVTTISIVILILSSDNVSRFKANTIM